jgi:hypothetical protein
LGYSVDDETNNTQFETLFKVNKKESFDTPLIKVVLLTLAIAKEPLLFFVLCIFNIIIAFKLNRHMNKKNKLTLPKKTRDNQLKIGKPVKNNSTFMILIICVIFLIGNFLDVLGTCLDIIDFWTYHPELNDISLIIGNILLFSSHSTKFFIYLIFDPNFKSKFFRVILKSKSRKYIKRSCQTPIKTIS